MKTIFSFVVASLMLMFNYSVSAQKKELPPSFEEANTLIEEKLWDQAVIEWERLLEVYPLNANYHYKVGMCMLQTKRKQDALEHLEIATGKGEFEKNYDPTDASEETPPIDALYYLAIAQHVSNKPDDALETTELLKTKIKNPGHLLLKDLPRREEQCAEASLQMKSPKKHVIKALNGDMNSEYRDFNGVSPQDLSVIYFSSNRERADVNRSNARFVNPETMEYEDDIYVCFKGASKDFGPAELLNITDDKGDRVMAVSADGHTLYLAKGDLGNADLMMTKLIGEKWTQPVALGGNINSKDQEMDMTISSDGKTIYFSSDRPGGLGGYDIWKSTLDKDGEWGPAENLGDLVNTKYNEISPSLARGGRTLYFSSEGHNTMGGYDIFYTKLDKKTGAGNAVNVGFPLSTCDDDYYFQAVPISRKGYYTSSKIGGKGLQDIYEVLIEREADETPVLLKGNVQLLAGSSVPDGLKLLANATTEEIKIESELKASSFEMKLPPCANYEVKLMLGETVLYQFSADAVCDESIMTIEREFYILPVSKRPEEVLASNDRKDKKDKKKGEQTVVIPKKSVIDPAETAQERKENVKVKNVKPAVVKPEGPNKKIAPTRFYFTYGIFKVKMEDTDLFMEELIEIMDKRGITDIDVYASASKVPRSNKQSNEELSRLRAQEALETIAKQLGKLGYQEGVHYRFRNVKSEVNGKEFENDARQNKEEYEKYQYVQLSAEG